MIRRKPLIRHVGRELEVVRGQLRQEARHRRLMEV